MLYIKTSYIKVYILAYEDRPTDATCQVADKIREDLAVASTARDVVEMTPPRDDNVQ